MDTGGLVAGALASAWSWDSLSGSLGPVLGVVALVLALKRWGQILPAAANQVFGRTDAALRQWAIAGLSLLALTLVLAGLMLAGA